MAHVRRREGPFGTREEADQGPDLERFVYDSKEILFFSVKKYLYFMFFISLSFLSLTLSLSRFI